MVLPLGVVWVVFCFGSACFILVLSVVWWFGSSVLGFLTCFLVCFACILVGSYLRAIMCLLFFGVLHNLLCGGWVWFGLVGGDAKF